MCGIYGIINNEEAPFDFSSFCTLGIANDSRGGDSCGIFIDGQVEYGIGKEAKFEEFFWNSKLLLNTERCKIAIGHDRKASVGGISLAKAHPIIIYDKYKNPEFVLIHNGTIHNYTELAKKYIPNIPINDLSDSQVLALLLYHSGFKCLNEYIGGTAFVAVDYRKQDPEVLIFRGESKQYKSSSEVSCERPLYIGRKDDNTLMFSSIASYLFACAQEIYEVPGNQVLRIKDNKLYLKQKVDRTACTQSVTQVSVYSGGGSYYGTSCYEYIQQDFKTNRYMKNERYLHGLYRVSQWGRFASKSEQESDFIKFYDIAAFNGIVLKDKKCLAFVYKVFKKFGNKDLDKFTSKNEFWIRYLSCDQLYFVNDVLLHADTPRKSTSYTGKHQMFGSNKILTYEDGIFIKECISQGDYSIPIKNITQEQNINLDQLWKDIKQLILSPEK